MAEDNPPEGFLRIDFDRDRPETTFNSHIGTLYARRGAKGTRDEFVPAPLLVAMSGPNTASNSTESQITTIASDAHISGTRSRTDHRRVSGIVPDGS